MGTLEKCLPTHLYAEDALFVFLQNTSRSQKDFRTLWHPEHRQQQCPLQDMSTDFSLPSTAPARCFVSLRTCSESAECGLWLDMKGGASSSVYFDPFTFSYVSLMAFLIYPGAFPSLSCWKTCTWKYWREEKLDKTPALLLPRVSVSLQLFLKLGQWQAAMLHSKKPLRMKIKDSILYPHRTTGCYAALCCSWFLCAFGLGWFVGLFLWWWEVYEVFDLLATDTRCCDVFSVISWQWELMLSRECELCSMVWEQRLCSWLSTCFSKGSRERRFAAA